MDSLRCLGDGLETWRFPLGLPAFEQHTIFRLCHDPHLLPFVFLHSEDPAPLRLICVPIRFIAADFSYELESSAAALLGIEAGPHCLDEAGIYVLATVVLPPDGVPTANLLAPIVLCETSRCGLQAVQLKSRWSHAEPLVPKPEGIARCS